MGGIGKTSLVKYVFRLHFAKFQKSSFIEGINARCNERFNGMLKLQKQLHGDISKTGPLQVNDVSVYTSKIENALARKRVFIVLDDIGSLDQLDSLIGNKGLHPGSKVIITTKDASLTKRCALFNPQVQPNHKMVSLIGLHESKSLELLCFHAFKSPKPREGYEEVSKKLSNYCDGHPLGLAVLGRSLRDRDVACWEECVEGLKKEPHSNINKALRISFDSLPLKNDKELFKHIACFFVGIDRDVTETILKACDINTKSGITNLIDKCLLSIGRWNELMMHQLIKEMGRDLVCQESPDKPWKRSRLWSHESFEVLKQKKDTKNVLGLALDMRMLEKEQLSGSLQLKTDALCKMDNLKLLQLNYVEMNGSYKNISKELRWLCMHGFHLKSIPSELHMENLVVLDMSHSNIEAFDMSYSISQRIVSNLKGLTGSSSKDKPLLGSLKILDLSFCEKLRSLCGFFELPVLERLIISNCTNLIQVCESIKHCIELAFVDMSNCKKLKKLPRTIGILKKVKTVVSIGCNLSVFPLETKDMDSLQTIEAGNFDINSQTSSSAVVEAIPTILRSFVSSLPASLVKLSIPFNNLSNESFPMDFSSLSMLKELILDGNPIVSMPSCVRTLPRLETLRMSICEKLKTVKHPPNSLRKLLLAFNYGIQEMKFNPEMSPFYWPFLPFKQFSMFIEGIIKVQPLAQVDDEVLCRLGWANFELRKYQLHGRISEIFKGEWLRVQMYYEFGIFSTVYGGKEMPNCIGCRSKGSSISFTIPSSPNELRGLNISYVLEKPSSYKEDLHLQFIVISNVTKNRTWIYNPYIRKVHVAERCVIFLSHWMFGEKEMEGGDQLTISIARLFEDDVGSLRECGVGFVYDDGSMKEEDVLGYYKSWNHIIGGDLSNFQTTTGEYLLSHEFFVIEMKIYPCFLPFVAESARSKRGMHRGFRAFSQQKSDLVVHPRPLKIWESRGGVLKKTLTKTQFRSVAVKMIESIETKIAIVDFVNYMFQDWKEDTKSRMFFSSKTDTLYDYLQELFFIWLKFC